MSTTATLETLLSSAPPGQLDGLVSDLSTLTPVPADLVQQIKTKSQIVSSDTSNSSSSTNDEQVLAKSLGEEWKAHQEKYYGSNSSIEHSFSIDSDNAGVTLRTLVRRTDTKNCHAGAWRGEWNISSDGTVLQQGTIHIHVYCHEDCNVQLETTKEYKDIAIVAKDGSVVAKAITNTIATLEANVTAELEEMYDTMNDKVKALRRVLPIMRTRLDWNVLAHRMVKKLEETAASN